MLAGNPAKPFGRYSMPSRTRAQTLHGDRPSERYTSLHFWCSQAKLFPESFSTSRNHGGKAASNGPYSWPSFSAPATGQFLPNSRPSACSRTPRSSPSDVSLQTEIGRMSGWKAGNLSFLKLLHLTSPVCLSLSCGEQAELDPTCDARTQGCQSKSAPWRDRLECFFSFAMETEFLARDGYTWKSWKSTCRRFSAITSAVRHGIFENLLLPKTLVEAVYPELCFGEC